MPGTLTCCGSNWMVWLEDGEEGNIFWSPFPLIPSRDEGRKVSVKQVKGKFYEIVELL